MRRAKTGSKPLAAFLFVFNLGVAAVIAIQWLGWPQTGRDEGDEGEEGHYARFAGDLRDDGSLQVGDMAPDFALGTADGESTVSLSSFRDQRPVVLLFGSYSCPMFRRQFGGLKQIHEQYKDRAEFLMVYIQEAHPSDGITLRENHYEGIRIAQHQTLDERRQAAATCAAALDGALSVLVDTMDNGLRKEYAAWPARVYVVGEDGRIAYKGNATPERFTLAEMVGPLEQELQAAATAAGTVGGG